MIVFVNSARCAALTFDTQACFDQDFLGWSGNSNMEDISLSCLNLRNNSFFPMFRLLIISLSRREIVITKIASLRRFFAGQTSPK